MERAEASFASLKNELEQTSRLATLGFLAAGIAHEINNILTPVLSYAQLAKASPHDASLQSKAVEKSIAGVEAAAQIVQAMLGFAAGDDQKTEANLQSVIQSALDCLARDLSKDGITLEVAVGPDTWVEIRPLALQQVILNLLINARAAMRGRRGTLRIGAISSQDGRTTITVADTGPGISRDVLECLFQPFATRTTTAAGRTQSRPSADQKGTGLGLSICKHLVDEADGMITVQSTQGEGAVFAIQLWTASGNREKVS
jgi:two-component system sensor kinase FixL